MAEKQVFLAIMRPNFAKKTPVSQWLSQQAVAKPDEIFVAACLKRKMAFGGSKDKPKHRLRACFLRGARV